MFPTKEIGRHRTTARPQIRPEGTHVPGPLAEANAL